jgi:hypothetical protein
VKRKKCVQKEFDRADIVRDEWASHSLRREFELVIMVDVLIEEMFGSD